MIGMKIDLESAKAEKIIPSQIPVAPRFSAYRGRSGLTTPSPSIVAKTEMNKTVYMRLAVFMQITPDIF
jgi:hypothetical protein